MRDLKLNAERRREEAESLTEQDQRDRRRRDEEEADGIRNRDFKEKERRFRPEDERNFDRVETERNAEKKSGKHHAEKREEASGREARDGRHFERLGRHLARANEARGRISHDVRENKVQRSVLAQGQRDYEARTREIKKKINLRRRRRTRTRATPSPGSGNVRGERELNAFLDERNKVRALSEELENPLNVHVGANSR